MKKTISVAKTSKVTKPKKTKIEKPPAVLRLDHSKMIDGKMWLRGAGPVGAKVMLILESPYPGDLDQVQLLADPMWDILDSLIEEAGLNYADYYITYGIKFAPASQKAPKASEFSMCWPLLKREIEQVKPELIVTFGAKLPKLFFGRSSSLSQFEGGIVDSEEFPGVKILPLYSPSYVARFADVRTTYVQNLRKILNKGEEIIYTVDYDVIDSLDKAKEFFSQFKDEKRWVGVDCEWHGDKRLGTLKLRTVQIKVPGSTIGIFKFKECLLEEETEDGSLAIPATADDAYNVYADEAEESAVWGLLKEFLEDPKSDLIGHNIRADGKELLEYGINIRSNTAYDTMLAEHCINSSGPFSLDVLSCKYTKYGRYDIPLEQWKNENKPAVKHGYGAIPDDLLFTYAALDVEVLFLIKEAQAKKLERYLTPRGKYPSLFSTAMITADILYELELTGMLVDTVQLQKSTDQYQTARSRLLAELQETVKGITNGDVPLFNPDSYKQKSNLLFDILKIAPVKSTSKPVKQWSWVARQSPTTQRKYNPAVDQETLELRCDAHPIVQTLLDYSRVNTICKNFLRNDDTGGIRGNMHRDGRLHARFSQLAATGRFQHRKPNVANFPKAAEGKLKDIIGGEVDSVRSVIVADKGYTFVEGDFSQAELYVLASLSNDRNFLKVLNTPGMDLHDNTTINTFKFKILYPDGSPYIEEEMLKLASTDFKLYEELKQQLIYVKPDGSKIDAKEFKLVRVSGKAVNFGVQYGRGAAAIQRQVQAEVGLTMPLEVFKDGLAAWHTGYPAASKFMADNGEKGIKFGYVENPFGRRRLFPAAVTDMQRGEIKREAGNAVIQSTVADALMLAMHSLTSERGALRFRIVNPIHDALMLLVKDEDLDATKILLQQVLESIEIPLFTGGHFSLGADIEEFKQWK